jgi:hypothetical protein
VRGFDTGGGGYPCRFVHTRRSGAFCDTRGLLGVNISLPGLG